MKNELPQLKDRLQRLRKFQMQGAGWALSGAEGMGERIRDNLRKQGRTGSHPPPLSGATRRIYAQDGPPNGSGIRNHIQDFSERQGSSAVAGVGIPQGKPSMVAQVQDRGCTIRVTARMRGWLAYRGIFLKRSTTAIRIPARRFWRRAWEETEREQHQKMRAMNQKIAKR